VVHKALKISRISFGSARGLLATAELDIRRPNVSTLFAGYPNADQAGFSMDLETPAVGRYWLRAEGEQGQNLPFAELILEERTQPRLLFMHIPKAAGSTVNSYLASHYRKRRHEVHVESHPKWNRDDNYFRSLDFISGHVTLALLAKRLNLENYYKVTVVREPYAQLASHLAWVRKLSDPGEEVRFKNHPDYIQQFSRKLLAADFSKPRSIRKLVKSLTELEQRLVENCQVRYFAPVAAGKAASKADLTAAIQACQIFDRIGTTQTIDEFLRDVARDMGWAEPVQAGRENISRGYYGLDISRFRTRSALEPLVRFDLGLYQYLEHGWEK
jgi:hypothetical protein